MITSWKSRYATLQMKARSLSYTLHDGNPFQHYAISNRLISFWVSIMTLDAILSPFKQYYDLHFLLPKRLGCWTFRSGIEVELAQLRQEIATERAERQALARLVDSLVTKVSWKKPGEHGGKLGLVGLLGMGDTLVFWWLFGLFCLNFFNHRLGSFYRRLSEDDFDVLICFSKDHAWCKPFVTSEYCFQKHSLDLPPTQNASGNFKGLYRFPGGDWHPRVGEWGVDPKLRPNDQWPKFDPWCQWPINVKW